MIAMQCSCGFTELADEEIADHLLLVFEPADGKGSDGLPHEEGERLTCRCGFTATTTEDLDTHLMKLFTPPDAIGQDGNRHEAV
jgi:hypothetical protein